MKNHIVIENDNLYILQRLKEIDESYFLVYNLLSKKYEVHSNKQKDNTYCFSVSFPFLDERTIDYARKTRIERIDEVIKEIDSQNEKIEQNACKEAINRFKEVLEWN